MWEIATSEGTRERCPKVLHLLHIEPAYYPDIFYGLLSVCINGVCLYHEYNEYYNDEFYKVKLE